MAQNKNSYHHGINSSEKMQPIGNTSKQVYYTLECCNYYELEQDGWEYRGQEVRLKGDDQNQPRGQGDR